ncbi:MAG: malto-oligosyltrehalose trehalohydrolase [Planctomycetota bacterium]
MTDFLHCPATDLHHHLGARPDESGTIFCVWAPTASEIVLEILDRSIRMTLEKRSNGLHVGYLPSATTGDRYQYRIDGGHPRPDPASRFQPLGVHGPSEIVSSQFGWTDSNWKGLSREDLVIYELHVGTFTESGTFRSAIDRLEELSRLGVTAIELMPVAASAGKWNWGYDGVAFFAPSEAFGTPDDFRALVNAAHERGLAVLLDVVYNHVGPEGNYLGDFGPYLSTKHSTVWGDAPNFDDPTHGDAVRRYFLANALHWIDEYHLDGLRVDAIHCMKDDRNPHFVSELSAVVHDAKSQDDRDVLLIAESNVYDPEMTQPRAENGIGFDAMWCDDFLHSVFASLRPGEQLSSRRYHRRQDLEQTLRFGYIYEGTLRKHRERRVLTERAASHDLIYSIQNHDFIGNHPLGKRLHQLAGQAAHHAAAALMILHPAIPMLFMGEEFACEHPFRFFVDFSDETLRQAVIDGRRREYPQHDWNSGVLPTDPAAFHLAKIGPAESGDPMTLQWYKALLSLRHQHRRSGLLFDEHLNVECRSEQDLFILRYERASERLTLAVRLGLGQDDSPLELHESGSLLLHSASEQLETSGVLHSHSDAELPILLAINQAAVVYNAAV